MARIVLKQCWRGPTQLQKVLSPVSNCSYSSNDGGSSLPGIDAPLYIQGFQGREHEFDKYKVRNLDRTGEESEVCTTGNVHTDVEDHIEYANNDCYQPMSNVSLYSVMQTNVPTPYTTTPGHMNMPGGGIKLGDKFTSSVLHDTHPWSKNFSTMSMRNMYSNKNAVQEKSSYSYGVNPEDMQGVQGPFTWLQNHSIESLSKDENPCPQGIQGFDCEKFKLWINNCTKYNFVNCDDQLQELKDGRKTLAQIFEEQERQIEETVLQYQSSGDQVGNKSDISSTSNQSNERADVKISQKDKLKNAVKQYGATVVVFHVGISLMSLGGFYVAVSSGLDVIGLLQRIGVGQSILESRLATGASTFVVAYAVHKVFAPARIAITLTCTPFIVRYLRGLGMLKAPKKL